MSNERVVAVRLLARIDQYQDAMRKASASTTKLSEDGRVNFARLGASMQDVGKRATVAVTLPLAGVGVAATKAAMDFETSFAQMQGLAGVSAGEIDNLRDSVLALSAETGRGPQELAEALYTLRSSGLDADDALDALNVSARASAAGLGSTATIADAVSSAMNAYAQSGLTAARATDILIGTARAGKAEPQQLAASLGSVLPVASQLGVSFEDVGGAIAALSLSGNNAATSTTLLNNVLMKMLKPSQQGAEALAEVGLSTDAVRQSIAERGLLGTLEMLKDRLGDAGFIKFMEDAQAVNGALALTGENAEGVAATFDEVKNSTGALDDAYRIIAETMGHKIAQSMSQMMTALIQIGEVLLPLAAEASKSIAALADWFANLDPAVQKVIVAIGGLAAAGGPAIWMAGTLVKSVTSLSTAFGVGAGTIGKAAGALGGLGLAITAGALIYNAYTGKSKEAAARTTEVADALGAATIEAWAYADATKGATDAGDGFVVAQRALSLALTTTGEDGEKLTNALGGLGVQSTEAFDVLIRMGREGGPQAAAALRALGEEAGISGEALDVLVEAVNSTDDQGEYLRTQLQAIAMEMGIGREEARAMADSLLPVANNMEEVQDQAEKTDLLALADHFLNTAVAADEEAEALIGLARERAKHNDVADSSVDVYMELQAMLGEMTEADRAAALETLGLVTAAEAATVATEDMTVATKELESVAANTIDTTTNLKQGFLDAAQAADDYRSAIDMAFGPTNDLVGAQDDLWEHALGLADALDEGSKSMSQQSEAGLHNRGVINDYAMAINALTIAQIATGTSVSDATNTWRWNREELLKNAEAAGLNREEVEAYLTEIGFIPENIHTAAVLAIDTEYERNIQAILEGIGNIPPEVATEITNWIDWGQWGVAQGVIDRLKQERVTVPVGLQLIQRNISVRGSGGNTAYVTAVASAAGRFVPGGTNMLSTLGEVGGSRGDEVVLPLGDPARMSALLGLSEVGPRVAAAMGSLVPAAPHLVSSSSADINIGEINVGDRRDLSAVRDHLSEAMWRHKTLVGAGL